MQFDAGLLAPFENGHAGHFRAAIGDDRCWLSPPGNETIQFASEPSALQRCVCDKAQAFAGDVIDNGQDTEPSPIGEDSADEVEAPAFVERDGTARGRRVPKARFRPPRSRTVSFSSR